MEKSKKCINCGFEKLLSEFANKRNECKICYNRRQKKYRDKTKKTRSEYNKKYRKEHIDALNKYKKNYDEENKEQLAIKRRVKAAEIRKKAKEIILEAKSAPCIDCGKIFPDYVMDFDHINPGIKIAPVSIMIGKPYSIKRILEEMAKCELRCANCHRNKTHYEQQRKKEVVSECITRRRTKQDYINHLKETFCMDCGGMFEPWQMDFDHRNPETKTLSIYDMVRRNFPLEKILQEIEKCDAVCVNCHRIRTKKQQGGLIK